MNERKCVPVFVFVFFFFFFFFFFFTTDSTAPSPPTDDHVRPLCSGPGEQRPWLATDLEAADNGQRPSEVRRQLEACQMAATAVPDDDAVRSSYNFAPGYHGLVYRADAAAVGASDEMKCKLQAMKWGTLAGAGTWADGALTRPHAGLVPSWTKRKPDYRSTMKTINCRDDSLAADRGMWTSLKKSKRCIVVAQGFYEWLQTNKGKDKLPHYTRRKDGQLMCFAGLWDSVRLEGGPTSVDRYMVDSELMGADSGETLYSYTIVTTTSSQQLAFLHDRMPVVVENGSAEMRAWLDPQRTRWSSELQAVLRPYAGELECYAVDKDVGKVGNESAAFVVPADRADRRSSIARFLGNQRDTAAAQQREGGQRGETPTGGGIKRGRSEGSDGGGGGTAAEAPACKQRAVEGGQGRHAKPKQKTTPRKGRGQQTLAAAAAAAGSQRITDFFPPTTATE